MAHPTALASTQARVHGTLPEAARFGPDPTTQNGILCTGHRAAIH